MLRRRPRFALPRCNPSVIPCSIETSKQLTDVLHKLGTALGREQLGQLPRLALEHPDAARSRQAARAARLADRLSDESVPDGPGRRISSSALTMCSTVSDRAA